MQKNKLLFVDNLRGIGSLFVLLWHLGCMFWYNNSAVAALCHIPEASNINNTVPKLYSDIINVIFSLNLDFGMMGVAIFFLISGFIIPYSSQSIKGKKFVFLLKRFLRIWPVYFIGFGITFMIMQFSGKLLNGGWIFSFKDYIIQASLLRDWFWIPSIDGISWTLEIEIKFYLLFYVLLLLKCENNPRVISGIAVVTALVSILFNANFQKILGFGRGYYIAGSIIVNFFIYTLYIFMGLTLYQLFSHNWSIKTCIAVEEILFACFYVSVYYGSSEQMGDKFVVNYGMALLLFFNFYALRNSIKQGGVLHFFAENSFSIYLLHGVNGYILLTFLYNAGIPMYINLPVTIAVILLLSWLFSKYIEKPINIFTRKYIINKFSDHSCKSGGHKD